MSKRNERYQLTVHTFSHTGDVDKEIHFTNGFEIGAQGDLTIFGEPIDGERYMMEGDQSKGEMPICFPTKTGIFLPAHQIVRIEIKALNLPERSEIFVPDNAGSIISPKA